jgi:hypothetical protein
MTFPHHSEKGREVIRNVTGRSPRARMVHGARVVVALERTCPRPKPRAQYAFKDSMIHGVLQFALRIAFRCALHRSRSQDIHRRELFNSVT